MSDTLTISQLTPEQKLMRETGIGASEIAAVCGISPFHSQLDVWMRKRTPTRAPLITDELSGKHIEMGNLLEDPYRAKYAAKVGVNVIKPPDSYRHPEYYFMLATPDGICWSEGSKNTHPVLGIPFDYGLEIKNVGEKMVWAWQNGVPEYVELQCRGNMCVFDIDRWDVFAGLGGSNYEIYNHLRRDMELEETIIEACRFFWQEYVEKDIAPPEDDPEHRRKLFKALFPGGEGKECVEPANPELFGELCQQYKDIKARMKEDEHKISDIQKELFGEIGDGYGLGFGRYKCTWGKEKGSPSYKAIAEELANGELPEALIEKHRGLPKRVCRVTVKKS